MELETLYLVEPEPLKLVELGTLYCHCHCSWWSRGHYTLNTRVDRARATLVSGFGATVVGGAQTTVIGGAGATLIGGAGATLVGGSVKLVVC